MNQVGIIGLGHVGATTALLMAQRGHIGHLVLVDKMKQRLNQSKLISKTKSLCQALIPR